MSPSGDRAPTLPLLGALILIASVAISTLGPGLHSPGAMPGLRVDFNGLAPMSNHNPGNTSNSSGTGPTLTYPVEFLENGLPPGTGWAVRLNGSSLTTTGASLTFDNVPSGSAAYEVGVPSGYSASPSSGSLNVNGSLRISVSFQADSGFSFSFWPLAPLEVELLVGIGILGTAGIVLSEVRDRRRRRRAVKGPKDEGAR